MFFLDHTVLTQDRNLIFCVVEGFARTRSTMDASIISDSGRDQPHQHFRFFDLPSELRLKVLGMVLLTDRTIDLDPLNHRSAVRRLNVFLTSHQLHEEAYRVFYSGHTFRILPTHGRFFGNKIEPLLSRLPSRYRAAMISLELRLGPGWSKPPKSWRINDRLGLENATSVRTLKVFVEIDPSSDIFKGFRVAKDFFTDFSGALLEGVIERLPNLKQIQFDAYPSVSRNGALLRRLVKEAEEGCMKIAWSSNRDWENDLDGVVGRMKCMGLNDNMLMIHGMRYDDDSE